MIYHNLVYDQFTTQDITQHEIAYSSFTCGPSTSKPTCHFPFSCFSVDMINSLPELVLLTIFNYFTDSERICILAVVCRQV